MRWKSQNYTARATARRILSIALALIVLRVIVSAEQVDTIAMPPLRVDGQPARAHTQGLEVIRNYYYVTARLDSSVPKRPILLRTEAHATRWEVWDLSPPHPPDAPSNLDHPGGMQSDGKHLWIPVAESVRHGRSVIRALDTQRLVPGQSVKAEFEFGVMDHIGAVAVAKAQQLLFGASWDTETVYVWDFAGHLQRTLSGSELKSRNLGAVPGGNGRAGVTVQDWKIVNDRLFASGLYQEPGGSTVPPKSRLLLFERFLEPGFAFQTIQLSTHEHTELAQEAMAISDGFVHYLPEDLGASNRLFRISLNSLLR